MNAKNIFAFFALVSIGLIFSRCDDNMPNYPNIAVESVQLKDDIRDGVVMPFGTTFDMSGMVVVVPATATNKKENYTSSDPQIAAVDELGIVSTISPGTVTMTITVDGVSASFPLVVNPPIPVSDLRISSSMIDEIMQYKTFNMGNIVTVIPDDAADKTIQFESSDPSVASIDANGKISGLSLGNTTITVRSVMNPEVFKTVDLEVIDFEGDHERDGWEVLPDFYPAQYSANSPEVNDPQCMFNGAPEDNVYFGLVRPGKTFNGVTNTDGYCEFTIDIKRELPVNYIRLRHRSTLQRLRYYKFERIYGSNDGVNFTPITTDFLSITPTPEVEANVESDNLKIPVSNYRYIKFRCEDLSCFRPENDGFTACITQFYMGYDPAL